MKQAYGKLGTLPTMDAVFKGKSHFVVTTERNGVTFYLTPLYEWSEDGDNAMRFPQRPLADVYANRVKGVVVERAP